jgi:Uncharacterized protein conserved in bacteria
MKHVMRNRSLIAAATLCAAAFSAACLFSCATPTILVASPDLTKVADGTWKGAYDGGLVKVEVAATLKSHRIESVAILKHECGKGKPAERIVDEIVAKQSLDVDTVSGATYSSKCILKATEIALESASSGAD